MVYKNNAYEYLDNLRNKLKHSVPDGKKNHKRDSLRNGIDCFIRVLGENYLRKRDVKTVIEERPEYGLQNIIKKIKD